MIIKLGKLGKPNLAAMSLQEDCAAAKAIQSKKRSSVLTHRPTPSLVWQTMSGMEGLFQKLTPFPKY